MLKLLQIQGTAFCLGGGGVIFSMVLRVYQIDLFCHLSLKSRFQALVDDRVLCKVAAYFWVSSLPDLVSGA